LSGGLLSCYRYYKNSRVKCQLANLRRRKSNSIPVQNLSPTECQAQQTSIFWLKSCFTTPTQKLIYFLKFNQLNLQNYHWLQDRLHKNYSPC